MYADIIIDISHEKLDRTFQYRIPDELSGQLAIGMQVEVPFGNSRRTGYVIDITDEPKLAVDKIKLIDAISPRAVPIESELIALAAWMRRAYGGTMNQALKTVLPVKEKRNVQKQQTLLLKINREEAFDLLSELERKHRTARARLLGQLLEHGALDRQLVIRKLNVTQAVIRAMEEQGIISIESQEQYRNPVSHLEQKGYHLTLSDAQQEIVDAIDCDFKQGVHQTYLIQGVTGSGKTEVYMELIARAAALGRPSIVLIPEIALTFQTAMRFYNRFGDRVSILHSRLSDGERYDQFLRAKKGRLDVMIGPRSALFTPFERLGYIIIDEEHEGSYKSENVPRYHARETAIARAKLAGASVILGSATPSVDIRYQAQLGKCRRFLLNSRINERPLPQCHLVDLREELHSGNRSILSRKLQELMEERLKSGQQMMLFINRRGMSAFVSCRECGEVIKCPHCDVSLSLHNNGMMKCHYCGYETPAIASCPKCGSKYIGGFRAGTQKIEEAVHKRFPTARILRMDYDTTRGKDGYEQILSAFANEQADILIGTQMIVKGHDFPKVTLVGVLAADLSLYAGDYRASERTFELLTQAAGRAGRGMLPGEVVIQTYQPQHMAIQTAKAQDYESFYEQELAYRQMMCYPPVWNLLLVMVTSKNEQEADDCSRMLAEWIRENKSGLALIGPTDAMLAKRNDTYRKVLYVKSQDYEQLIEVKDCLERLLFEASYRQTSVQFDFNPMNGF